LILGSHVSLLLEASMEVRRPERESQPNQSHSISTTWPTRFDTRQPQRSCMPISPSLYSIGVLHTAQFKTEPTPSGLVVAVHRTARFR
jgi:hypothetical protein